MPSIEVVGVVSDSIYASLRETIPAIIYLPFSPAVPGAVRPSAVLSVRARSGQPEALARGLVAALSDVDKDLGLMVRPFVDQIDASLARERLLAMLSGFFGTVALLLAGLGLYGVLSYAVSRRRREIGIRMALGARPAAVRRLVLGRVGWLLFVGIAIGTGVSLWAGRFVATLLYGFEPRDPVLLAIAGATLIAVGLVAAWLPARRAARVDPANVLREG